METTEKAESAPDADTVVEQILYLVDFCRIEPEEATEQPADCINKAGFNVCEEEVVEEAVVAAPVAAKSAPKASEPEVVEQAPLTTQQRMDMKDAKAGTCYNRSGFETPCK